MRKFQLSVPQMRKKHLDMFGWVDEESIRRYAEERANWKSGFANTVKG